MISYLHLCSDHRRHYAGCGEEVYPRLRQRRSRRGRCRIRKFFLLSFCLTIVISRYLFPRFGSDQKAKISVSDPFHFDMDPFREITDSDPAPNPT